MVDFEVNYRAATRLRAGESLYPMTDGHFMFKYLPFSAALYLPLSFLSLGAAKAVWYGITVLCTIALFVVSARLVSPGRTLSRFEVALPALVLAKFCFRELKLGQINTLVVLLLLLMVAEVVPSATERGRPGRAGALWALATAIKPYGLIFLPYFLLRRSWIALASGAAVLAAALLFPALFYGLDGNVALHREWLRTLSQSTPAQLTVNDNVSVVGLVAKWTGDAAFATRAALVTTPLLGLLVLAVMVRGRNVERAPVLECAVLLTLIPLVSPLGWDYQLLTSVLAVTLLAHRWDSFPRKARVVLGLDLAIIALSIYDLVGRAAYQTFMAWSVLTPAFLLVVGYVSWLRLRRLA